MKRIALTIPDPLRERLESHSERTGISISEWFRRWADANLPAADTSTQQDRPSVRRERPTRRGTRNAL